MPRRSGAGQPLRHDQVTVVGWSTPSQARQGIRSVSLADVRRLGASPAARQALDGISARVAVLVHLDVDVFRRQDLPASYFPRTERLSVAKGADLLGPLLRDPRIRLIELAEYASLRDPDLRSVGALVDLLAGALRTT